MIEGSPPHPAPPRPPKSGGAEPWRSGRHLCASHATRARMMWGQADVAGKVDVRCDAAGVLLFKFVWVRPGSMPRCRAAGPGRAHGHRRRRLSVWVAAGMARKWSGGAAAGAGGSAGLSGPCRHASPRGRGEGCCWSMAGLAAPSPLRRWPRCKCQCPLVLRAPRSPRRRATRSSAEACWVYPCAYPRRGCRCRGRGVRV